VNILRRLPLSRLLLLCGLALGIGVSATALAFALGTGPTPPPRPLAQAVHDALSGGSGEAVQGVSANITLTNHLLEGANLASDAGGSGSGGISSNPLLTGGSGRLWVAKNGDMRLELQQEQGDTELVWDGTSLSVYDAASNTVFRYVPKAGDAAGGEDSSHGDEEVPSVAKIEEAITRIRRHADLSNATPTDVAGQPAYTVRVAPQEAGSLLGGAELSFDADNGVPLRTAIYSSTSSAPVIELAATEISFGPVPSSIFQISPPPGAKVETLTLSNRSRSSRKVNGQHPKVTIHGHGPTAVAVLEAKPGSDKSDEALEGLPKVEIDGTSASELRTELGTLLTFERSGVRYVLGGALPASSVEAIARSL
jgi:outer membrane lipoprotein-sorting protein